MPVISIGRSLITNRNKILDENEEPDKKFNIKIMPSLIYESL